MTDVQFSRNFNWMIGECLKSNTQLDMKQYQMIWNFFKWCCDVQNCQIQWNLNIEYEYHHTSYETNKSHSEAEQQIEQWHPMMCISVSQHFLINTRTLICHYNSMSILFNKKAYLYTYSRNENWVSSYSETWSLFSCNIQPLNTKDWIEWMDFLKMRKIYSKIQLNVWDKVVCDWTTYIVDRTEHRDWTMRKFFKSFIIESNWN